MNIIMRVLMLKDKTTQVCHMNHLIIEFYIEYSAGFYYIKQKIILMNNHDEICINYIEKITLKID